MLWLPHPLPNSLVSVSAVDCWDGPNGEPIIYHGFTLTSKLKFRDVIEAVRDNAFCHNPYPGKCPRPLPISFASSSSSQSCAAVILSFENHCSKPFQKRMAEHLLAILGDLLAVPADFPNRMLYSACSLHHLTHTLPLPSNGIAVSESAEVSHPSESEDSREESRFPTIYKCSQHRQ